MFCFFYGWFNVFLKSYPIQGVQKNENPTLTHQQASLPKGLTKSHHATSLHFASFTQLHLYGRFYNLMFPKLSFICNTNTLRINQFLLK